jgi:hypothetical protein
MLMALSKRSASKGRLTVLSLWFGRLTTLSSVERPKEERVGMRGWKIWLTADSLKIRE